MPPPTKISKFSLIEIGEAPKKNVLMSNLHPIFVAGHSRPLPSSPQFLARKPAAWPPQRLQPRRPGVDTVGCEWCILTLGSWVVERIPTFHVSLC